MSERSPEGAENAGKGRTQGSNEKEIGDGLASRG